MLILSLEILHYEARPLGLEINWDKTKIQGPDPNAANPSSVSVLGNSVELVELEESFTYLGCRNDAHGGSEEEIRRRIEVTRGCMKSLTKNIWRSSISPRVKIQLYNTYVLPVLLYGSEMWDMTVRSSKRLDAFDQCMVPSTHSTSPIYSST